MKVAQALGWRQVATTSPGADTSLLAPGTAARNADRIRAEIRDWTSSSGPALRDAAVQLIDGVDDPGLTGARLLDLLAPFVRPDEHLSRGVDLLIISAYVPPLREQIEATLGDLLTTWLAPGRDRTTRTRAAIRAFALGLALGYVTESWRSGGTDLDLTHKAEMFAHAFTAPATPARLPAIRAAHLDRPPEWSGDDASWEAVFLATLDCVGELGFEATSVDIVAAAAGVSPDTILSEYPSMRDLFLQASDRMLAPGIERNTRYQLELQAAHPTAIADACIVRENMRPERRRMRTVTLEQLRLAAHDQRMQDAFRDAIQAQEQIMALTAPSTMTPAMLHATVTTELAITSGLCILAQIRPETWRLDLCQGFWTVSRVDSFGWSGRECGAAVVGQGLCGGAVADR